VSQQLRAPSRQRPELPASSPMRFSTTVELGGKTATGMPVPVEVDVELAVATLTGEAGRAG
jgi:hypothetical protein